MNTVHRTAPFVLFALVATGCGAFLISRQTRPACAEATVRNLKAVHDSLATAQVSATYAYSPQAAAALKCRERMKLNLGRAESAPPPSMARGIVYQEPARPYVEPEVVTIGPAPETPRLGELSEVAAKSDASGVFLTWKLPQKDTGFESVAVEVFRAETARAINAYGTPLATVDYFPETFHVVSMPAKRNVKSQSAAGARSNGEKRRAAHERDDAAPKTGVDSADLPLEFAGLQIFHDSQVQPHKTYYYRLRLIGRLSIGPQTRIVLPDSSSGECASLVHTPKDNPSSDENEQFIVVSQLSESVCVTLPDNFEIRLAGTIGELPRASAEHLGPANCRAVFSVKLWLPESQEWKHLSLQLNPGDALQAPVTYNSPGTTAAKVHAFDSGYTLAGLEWREPPDKPAKGSGTRVPVEVAIMRDNQGKLIEFQKTGDLAAREKSFQILSRIWAAQREEAQRRRHALELAVQARENAEKPARAEAEAEAARKELAAKNSAVAHYMDRRGNSGRARTDWFNDRGRNTAMASFPVGNSPPSGGSPSTPHPFRL